jgi:hypothetical protein
VEPFRTRKGVGGPKSYDSTESLVLFIQYSLFDPNHLASANYCVSVLPRGVTKRCRLYWLTNSALVYEPICGGEGEFRGSANEYSCTQEPKRNFGDLTPWSYLIAAK